MIRYFEAYIMLTLSEVGQVNSVVTENSKRDGIISIVPERSQARASTALLSGHLCVLMTNLAEVIL